MHMPVSRWALTVVPTLATVVVAGAAQDPGTASQGQRGAAAAVPPMTLTTTAFPDGGQIPAKYTQAADQISPALTWTNAPPNTVSFVLHIPDLEVAPHHTADDQ